MTVATSSIQEEVAEARGSVTPLRIAGRSHWLEAGRPVSAERVLTTAAHRGIVDYVPGDLTITVRSGTSLREISEVTSREGQWFPLDPFGDDDGTIGATISTGSSGPLAQRFGAIRDLVLGLEFIAGDGKVVRGGGRVVKNVAGFDLTRLLTGSWGTLGVITEATLRLYAQESQRATFVLPLPEGFAQMSERIAAVRSAPLVPFATVLADPSVAAHLGLPGRTSLLIEVGGNSAAVASQRDALATLGAEAIDTNPWSALRVLDGQGSSVVRISTLASRVAEVWQIVRSALDPVDGALLHANIGLGILRCIIPGGADVSVFGRIVAGCTGCTSVFETLPANVWNEMSPTVKGDRLSRGIKAAFDPLNILNPGILGD
ncbi:MAG: FAD-binding protein [Gemmatimonadaceae bacterium]